MRTGRNAAAYGLDRAARVSYFRAARAEFPTLSARRVKAKSRRDAGGTR
jgi:hypothetical protein